MKSVFRYPGGKSKLLPKMESHLKQLIDGSDSFFDCFVGGGSVLLWVAENYPDLQLNCNDKNFGIYSFWSLVSTGVDDFYYLLDIKPTLELFYQIRDNRFFKIKNISLDKETELGAAIASVILNRTSFSGMGVSPIGGKEQKSEYKIDCRYNYDKLCKNLEKINKLLKNRLVCYNFDINYLLTNYTYAMNNRSYYLDPPYFVKGPELYSVYMKNNEHINLRDNLTDFDRWLLSYDNCPEIRELYQDNEILEIDAKYSINGEKTQHKECKELLIKSKGLSSSSLINI